MNTEPTDLQTFLSQLSGAAGAAFWMLNVSNVIRNWKEADPKSLDSKFAMWVHDMNSFSRLIFTAAVSISAPLVAGLILLFVPAEVLTAMQPVFALIASTLLVYFVQQGYFQLTKSNLPPGTITAKTTASSTTMTVTPTDPKADAAGR